jgi:hypothetical protein
MKHTKTGAIVCKKQIEGTLQLEYEALLFISEIPHDVTDEQLASLLSDRVKVMNVHECREVLIRADINASANEIWEQYKGLNNDAGKSESISYFALIPA